ncbi:MAG: hypothetical protein LC746_13585, partial [Acidobacteria bacterium]|nr:hypothetical protein [Acidobacteriota bacterium]
MSTFTPRDAATSHAAVPSAALTVLPLLLLLTVVGGLVTYKATDALAVIEKVRATGTIKPRFDLVGAGSASAWLGVFGRTYSYFSAVW